MNQDDFSLALAVRCRLPLTSAISFFAVFLCATMTDAQQPVTIAIVNGAVWTGDLTKPWAQAVALSGERIVVVGSTLEIRRRVSSQTRIIDAKGGMVVPGFIDSHVHFLAGGLNLASVQLRDAK